MKTGRTLTELAAEIERMSHHKQDLVASTTSMEMVPVEGPSEDRRPRLVVNNVGAYPIRPLALRQIGDRLQIPAKYVDRMAAEAPHLLATNVNHWFRENPERRMVRLLDLENRAFLSDTYARTDYFDVAQVALPTIIEAGCQVASCEITEQRMYIKAFFPGLTREIKSTRPGDMVRAGLMVSTSEVGLGATVVTPWAEFTVCTNGMKREGGYRKAHLGKRVGMGDDVAFLTDETIAAADRADLLIVRDHIKAALDPARFEAWINSVQQTTERRFEASVDKGVEVLAQKFGMLENERRSVLAHLIAGGDLSQYGLINAVTRTAQDLESYDRATEFEAMGAAVMDLNKTEWRQIAEAA